MTSALSSSYHIEKVDFADALGDRYLAYALSTIMSRSLPDVRDGLKPVHRRLLYAMQQLNLNPKANFKKCARVVGDVIGKYHPHGDVAVYETLVRLAQEFSVRYPLIEGQGNFGSIDGDNAAAMRYTESRLTELAITLLDDIAKNTVDFKSTYDDQDLEPTLLPAAFPNLLANGSEGIAVGMATSIPPHNLHELCTALIKLIANPDITISELIEMIPGPDFPTGGVIVEPKANILHAYDTGRGSFRLRAKWRKEQLAHGLYQIVITEIPYQVQKSKLIEKIAELFRDKKLALLGNIRDESAEDIRLILEPKNRHTDPDILMESLFKMTDLEIRFNLNMNVLDATKSPRVMSIKQVLQCFVDHRLEILTRRSNFRLKQIMDRLEILEGLIIAYLNLDEIINIIRQEDEPKPILMARFKLTDTQADAILNLRLRSLRKLEEVEIRAEHNSLSLEQQELALILSDETLKRKTITKEIKLIQDKFGFSHPLGKRRTEFGLAGEFNQVIAIEAFIEKEPITISLSKMGWIRAIKGHNNEASQDLKFKEGDEGRLLLKGNTTDNLLIFTQKGKFYTILCDKIQKGKGHGDPVRIMIELDNDDEILDMMIHTPGSRMLVAAKSGKGFVVEENDVIAQTKVGKQILNLGADDKALLCKRIDGDMIAIIGEHRKMLVYKVAELPIMKRGQGVMLQKYKHTYLSDVKFFNESEGLTWNLGNKTRTETNLLTWLGKRGSIGRMPPVGFPRNNKF